MNVYGQVHGIYNGDSDDNSHTNHLPKSAGQFVFDEATIASSYHNSLAYKALNYILFHTRQAIPMSFFTVASKLDIEDENELMTCCDNDSDSSNDELNNNFKHKEKVTKETEGFILDNCDSITAFIDSATCEIEKEARKGGAVTRDEGFNVDYSKSLTFGGAHASYFGYTNASESKEFTDLYTYINASMSLIPSRLLRNLQNFASSASVFACIRSHSIWLQQSKLFIQNSNAAESPNSLQAALVFRARALLAESLAIRLLRAFQARQLKRNHAKDIALYSGLQDRVSKSSELCSELSGAKERRRHLRRKNKPQYKKDISFSDSECDDDPDFHEDVFSDILTAKFPSPSSYELVHTTVEDVRVQAVIDAINEEENIVDIFTFDEKLDEILDEINCDILYTQHLNLTYRAKKSTTWLSVLQIAVEFEAVKFLMEPLVQDCVSKIWNGELSIYSCNTHGLLSFYTNLPKSELPSEKIKVFDRVGIFSREIIPSNYPQNISKESTTPSKPVNSVRRIMYGFPALSQEKLFIPKYQYAVNTFANLLLLLLYTLVVNNRSFVLNGVEVSMYVLIIGLTISEVQELRNQGKNIYFKVLFNINDCVSLTLLTLALFFRIYGQIRENDNKDLYSGTIDISYDILSCAAIFLWTRLIYLLSRIRAVGEMIFTIKGMLKDTLLFLIFFVFILLGFLQAFVGLYQPNVGKGPDTSTMSDTEPKSQTRYLSDSFNLLIKATLGDPAFDTAHEIHHIVGEPMLIIFLFFSTIMLINMLVAFFNNSYEEIREDRSNGPRVMQQRQFSLQVIGYNLTGDSIRNKYLIPVLPPGINIIFYVLSIPGTVLTHDFRLKYEWFIARILSAPVNFFIAVYEELFIVPTIRNQAKRILIQTNKLLKLTRKDGVAAQRQYITSYYCRPISYRLFVYPFRIIYSNTILRLLYATHIIDNIFEDEDSSDYIPIKKKKMESLTSQKLKNGVVLPLDQHISNNDINIQKINRIDILKGAEKYRTIEHTDPLIIEQNFDNIICGSDDGNSKTSDISSSETKTSSLTNTTVSEEEEESNSSTTLEDLLIKLDSIRNTILSLQDEKQEYSSGSTPLIRNKVTRKHRMRRHR